MNLFYKIIISIFNKLNSQKSIEEKELDEGYKLFNERNENIKRGIKNKIYSKEEIRLIMLAIDDWVSRIKLSRIKNNWWKNETIS